MSVSLPNGAVISIASGYGPVKAMSALTNATEGVATLEASHGVVENDILEITSGWSKLNGRIARADSVATNDVTLEDINTSSTIRFPAGSGIGSVREISGWTQIAQVLETNSSGGDQNFTEYGFLEDDTRRQIPTDKSPEAFTVTIADDPTLAAYPLLSAADEDRVPRAVRIQLPNGSAIYWNAFVTLKKTPSLTKNEVMAVTATMSLTAEVTRYAA